jgi:hypothetical protein
LTFPSESFLDQNVKNRFFPAKKNLPEQKMAGKRRQKRQGLVCTPSDNQTAASTKNAATTSATRLFEQKTPNTVQKSPKISPY